ncbi:YceI family protein [Pseudomonas schmalbachii]|uniref:YceI family protein n=1 Tax=Pseudomonas schmalbachii TaxID=2816993 RepID=A0ABS3TMU9_9PSED|nr:YceI family protein [Pseudomonas schmalbachii]MBO3274983.1 YceI family protein [Pseudomonas schmalbachii]
MRSLFAFLVAALWAASAQAAWYLDYESSRLTFVTTKNADVAEVSRFLVMHGSVSDKGEARLRIELDSVSSGIPLRDERMREQLFDSKDFPLAKIEAQLDLRPIVGLADGVQLEMRLPLSLTLHGQSRKYTAEVLVTRLDEHRFQVVTLSPLVVSAADFGLTAGVESLRKLAGLKNIGQSVPVGAVLIFASR